MAEWWSLNEWTMPRRWPVGEAHEEPKRQRTLHSPEEVARARRHVQTRAWAKDRLKQLLAQAEPWSRKSDVFLWDLVPATTVPRRHYVNQLRGCPAHGTGVKDFDTFHPWRLDVENHPWKLQCPVGGERYPSNDFAGGDLTSGPYPDDGWGCRIGDEEYYFIAEYAELVYLGPVKAALSALSEAYLLTGDALFAHKAAVLLHRVAEEYRHLSECLDDRARCDCGYPRHLPRAPLTRPNGNGWVGMITDRIWENGFVDLFATAYDHVFDAIDGDRSLLDLLNRKGRDIPDGPAVRRFFETHFLRVAAQALLDRSIFGNDGMHQRAMMNVAIVLDSERSRELVDWVYFGPGQMAPHLPNYYHKDGAAYESLGGYNRIHGEGFWDVVRQMERIRALRPGLYPTSRYPRVADDPKARLLFDFPLRTVCIDRHSPLVGDTGGVPSTRRPERRMVGDDAAREAYDFAFRTYGDRDYARVLHGEKGDLPHPDLFAEEIDDRVMKVVRSHGLRIERRTDVRDGYGIAILRAGSDDDARALFLWYGDCRGHAHDDFLDIGLFAKGLGLMQSLGYPRSWHHCEIWEKNWATHFKVGIAGLPGWARFKSRKEDPPDPPSPRVRYQGRARLVTDLGPVQAVEAFGDPYGEGDGPRRNQRLASPEGRGRKETDAGPVHLQSPLVYSRTALLLDLSDADCCVVDLFRVRGGREHIWSFHGPPGPMDTEGARWIPQEGGTVAGQDIPYGGRVEEESYRALAYLDQVSRATPEGLWSGTWRVGDSRDTRLRVTVASPPGAEAIRAKGRPVSGGKPYELDFLLARAPGPHATPSPQAPHASQFISVIEPYSGSRVVNSIVPLAIEGPKGPPFPPVALRISTPARSLTVLATAAPRSSHRVDGRILFEGEYGVICEEEGRIRYITMIGSTRMEVPGTFRVEAEMAWVEAKIEAVDRSRNEVTVRLPPNAVDTGRFVTICNDLRSVTYRVEAVRYSAGRTHLALNQAPRIGEGIATEFRDLEIDTETQFPLASQHGTNYPYYAGSRLTDASGENEFRVTDLRKPGPESAGYRVYLDPEAHPDLTAKKLRRVFARGKDRRPFHLWDFGAGDRLRFPSTVVVSFEAGEPRILANVPVELKGAP